MPTTAKGLPYPASTAAPNVPADLQALAQAVDAQLYVPRYKRKNTAENVTNSIVMQDDDELLLSLPVGNWRVEAFLNPSGPAAADVNIAWAFTGVLGVTHRACIGPATGMTSAGAVTSMRTTVHGITTQVSYGLDGTAASAIHEDLLLVVATAGTLKLQWAQNAANATPTVMAAGSTIYATPMAAG